MNDFVFVTQLHDEQFYVLSQSLNVIECALELIEVKIVFDVLDIFRMTNPMKNGFTTFLTCVFNLIPKRLSENIVVLDIMSYPRF